MHPDWDEAGTFSIVAADPTTGEVGCAVQSKYFAIGAVTPWVRAGVGSVATQAMGVVARNGERALSALAAQVDPAAALARALADDHHRELRQIGAVTADGEPRHSRGMTAWSGRDISLVTGSRCREACSPAPTCLPPCGARSSIRSPRYRSG